ncbi:MAG TPA: hypothetical protein VGX95_00300 [Xanthobacteraceae bacterium]|jgi:hypothetical protein|nr:hypothetical protein [Xanthobacteraceae bacterium]
MAGKSSAGAKGWAAAALAGVVAGLMAAQLFAPAGTPAGAAGAAEIAAQVDRTHKGDRLDVALSLTPDARASGRTALRHLMQLRNEQLREMCEPPASPYVDPQLAKLPGRCLT